MVCLQCGERWQERFWSKDEEMLSRGKSGEDRKEKVGFEIVWGHFFCPSDWGKLLAFSTQRPAMLTNLQNDNDGARS